MDPIPRIPGVPGTLRSTDRVVILEDDRNVCKNIEKQLRDGLANRKVDDFIGRGQVTVERTGSGG